MIETTPFPLSHEAYAAELRREIDAALDRCTQFTADCPARLAEAMRYSLLAPGKRLRPVLTLIAAEACGSPREVAMPAACAVEMIHAYSLIHDDLPAMDDDDLRRGRPTCHIAFDEATAILAGDGLLALAFEVLAAGVPPQVAGACCAELAQAAGPTMLVGGQADDLAAEHGDGDSAALHKIHRRKTGAMIRVAIRLGGLIAGTNAETLAALTTYGEKIGLAFQVIDDWLDVQGNEAALGKRVGKDAGIGKLTFPSLLGIEGTREYAERLIDEACAAIRPLGTSAVRLEAAARYVTQRKN